MVCEHALVPATIFAAINSKSARNCVTGQAQHASKLTRDGFANQQSDDDGGG